MKLKFLKAHYGINFKIPKDFVEILKNTFSNQKNNRLAIYSSIQFIPNQKELIELLKIQGFETVTSKPDRTSFQGQILGCDSYADNLKIDISSFVGFVYIGDGYFHPNALLLAQENEKDIKPVIILNPVQQITEVIDKNQIKKYLKKKKVNMIKFQMSNTIGVFVTSKWGQEYKTSALKLKSLYPDKKFYFFAGDNFLDNELENFPYIECWVNTACPRIGQDDITRHSKSVINIKDIYR